MRFFAAVMIFAFLFCAFPGTASAQKKLGDATRVDSVLASVNGEPITLLDVILESGKEEMNLASMFSGERLYTETEKLRKTILEEIIVRKLVYQTYKAKPFKIEQQYVEDMLDILASTMGDGTRKSLERRAKELGTSMEELREKALEKIAVDAILTEFCDKLVYVTPKDVYEEYQNNHQEWMIPEQIEFQLLQLSRNADSAGSVTNRGDACEKLAESLQNADEAAFAKAVKANSDGPNAAAGGKMGLIDRAKLRPEFADALKERKPGDVTGVIETREAFFILRVVGIKAASRVEFKDVSGKIRKSLTAAARQKRRAEYSARLKHQAFVRYYF